MTTITLPRAVVEQALEALEQSETTVPYEGFGMSRRVAERKHQATITALRAALAQQAHTDDLNQRIKLYVGARCAPPQQAEPVPQTCTWQQDGDSDSGVYSTSCRRYFSLEDGTPEDNKMAWCCYCGKKLVQELITDDEHD